MVKRRTLRALERERRRSGSRQPRLRQLVTEADVALLARRHTGPVAAAFKRAVAEAKR